MANKIEYKIKRYEPRLNDVKVTELSNNYGLVVLKVTGAFTYDQNIYFFETLIDLVL